MLLSLLFGILEDMQESNIADEGETALMGIPNGRYTAVSTEIPSPLYS